MTAVWFVVAAAVGALTRHAVNHLGRGWVGTLAVNVLGSFLLGWLVMSDLSSDTLVVLGTAGCGSFTTFSMFALETVEADGVTRIVIVSATVGGTLLGAAAGTALA